MLGTFLFTCDTVIFGKNDGIYLSGSEPGSCCQSG